MTVADEKFEKSEVVTLMNELATVVRDMATDFYKNDVMDDDDDDMEVEKMPMYQEDEPMMEEEDDMDGILENELPMDEDLDMEDDMMKGEEPMMDDIMDDEAALDEEIEMMRHQWKAIKAKIEKRKANKGYAATAKINADEEDAPFDEGPDGDVKGNEASPAGEQGGEREDETFNVKFMRDLTSELKRFNKNMEKRQQSGVKSKAIVPGLSIKKGRETQADNMITRDMEEQAKGRTWSELADLRVTTGDLPGRVI